MQNTPVLTSCNLLFTDTDTDSLAYAVDRQTSSIEILMMLRVDDFSEYSLDHPLYDTSNRKALGFFKDELNSVPMREFVGLRPK